MIFGTVVDKSDKAIKNVTFLVREIIDINAIVTQIAVTTLNAAINAEISLLISYALFTSYNCGCSAYTIIAGSVSPANHGSFLPLE